VDGLLPRVPRSKPDIPARAYPARQVRRRAMISDG